MGPTYHLNRFEEKLLQNAAKAKNLSSANLNTIGCQSMETADTYEKPILLDEQEDVDEEDAVLESEE